MKNLIRLNANGSGLPKFGQILKFSDSPSPKIPPRSRKKCRRENIIRGKISR